MRGEREAIKLLIFLTALSSCYMYNTCENSRSLPSCNEYDWICNKEPEGKGKVHGSCEKGKIALYPCSY